MKITTTVLAALVLSALSCISGPVAPLAAQSLSQQDFESWKQQQETEFARYLSEEDRAFSQFLEREAKLLNPQDAEAEDLQPKPDTPPVFSPEEDPAPQPSPQPAPEPDSAPEPPPAEPPVEEDAAPVSPPTATPGSEPASAPRVPRYFESVELSFYGTRLQLRYPAEIVAPLSGKISQEKIAGFWKDAAASEYDPFVEQLLGLRRALQLNDWGYALLIQRLGEQLYPGNRNAVVLFTWFGLVKSEYATSLAFTANEVFLLVNTQEQLYGVPYFSFMGTEGRFYLLTLGGPQALPGGSLYTYDRTFPGAEQAFDFTLTAAPKIGSDLAQRRYSFTYAGERYQVPVSYNRQFVDFLEWYPQMRAESHFLTAGSEAALQSLRQALGPIIAGKSETEAANILLRFVQTAFAYETDQAQFDREKLMNPDEILHYNRSDCDDRSILYTYLVRNMLELQTAGLDYPGHLATAVRFRNRPSGDTVEFEGQRYLVCDPTYINADIGHVMPSVRGRPVRVFAVR